MEPILIEDPSPEGPSGAKGKGEEQTRIRTVLAILNANHHATGTRIGLVPATLHPVRAAILTLGVRR